MQVMKTYHMYNADSISAQSKLKEAEKQEEKQIGKSVKQEDRQTPRSPDSTANVRIEEKHVRRSSVKKIEKMKEKVSEGNGARARRGEPCTQPLPHHMKDEGACPGFHLCGWDKIS